MAAIATRLGALHLFLFFNKTRESRAWAPLPRHQGYYDSLMLPFITGPAVASN